MDEEIDRKRKWSWVLKTRLLITLITGAATTFYLAGCASKGESSNSSISTSIEIPKREWLDDQRGCSTQELDLLKQEIPAFCARVLYITDRSLGADGIEAVFTSSPSQNLSFGYSEIAVPLIRTAARRDYEAGRSLYAETFARFESLRSDDLQADTRLGIRRLSLAADHSGDSVQQAFVKDLSNFAAEGNGSALLYIPGWGHDFNSSLFRAAQLSQDIAFNFGDQFHVLESTRNKYPLGQPIIFSWPTNQSDIRSDRAYIRDRSQAARSSENLSRALNLIAESGVHTINIIAWSMGNEVLINALEEFAELRAESGGSIPTMNIVHAASDAETLDQEETYARYLNIVGDDDLNVTNYGATTDFVVAAAPALESIGSDADLFGVCRAGFHGACEKFFVDNKNIASISADLFLTENIFSDSAFHGYFAENPTVLADMSCALSGIQPGRNDADNQRPLAKRTKRDGIFSLYGKAVSTHWVFDASEGGGHCIFTQPYAFGYECDVEDPAEADACGRLVKAVSDRSREAAGFFVNLLGSVLAESRNGRDSGDQEPEYSLLLSVLFDLDSAQLSSEHEAEIRGVKGQLPEGGLPLKLVVAAYADTSGEESRNYELAARRASTVETALREVLSFDKELGIEIRIVGETERFGTSSDDQVSPFGGMRQPLNRRVEVYFCSGYCR